MNAALQAILDFVEGRMTPTDFEQRVYSDPALEETLKDASLKWNGTYVKSNPYDYILALNYRDPGDVLNIQGAMELFLERKGVAFKRAATYSDYFDVLLSAQPRWLELSKSAYLTNQILPQAGDRKGKELESWLRNRLLELFRYSKKPPKWIQSPAWPINENGPLYFLGQIKVDDPQLFHDDAAVYVFLDRTTGETTGVIQVF